MRTRSIPISSLITLAVAIVTGCGSEEPTSINQAAAYDGPGVSRSDPAGIGHAVPVMITDFVTLFGGFLRLTLLEVLSGDTARNRILSWDAGNPLPDAGHEYILARFRVQVVRVDDCCSYYMTPNRFTVLDPADRESPAFEELLGVTPEMRRSIPLGESYEGYVVFHIVSGIQSIVAAFDLSYLHRRFFKLR
jgi:hypothetical protein